MGDAPRRPAGALVRLTDGYLFCMLTVYLLYTGSGGYSDISGQKWRLFLWLSGGYLALAAALRLELWLVGRCPAPAGPAAVWRRLSWPQRCIVGYWSWSALSALLSVDRHTALWGGGRMEGLLAITLYCGCFLLVSCLAEVRRWQLWAFAAAVGVCCIVALLQLAGYNPLGLYPAGLTYQDGNLRYSGQFLGTVGNAGLLAAVLCVAVPLLWVSLLRGRGRRRLLLLLPLGLSTAALLLSRVEAGLLGIFGGLLLSLPVMAPERTSRRRLAVGTVLALAACLALTYCFGGRAGGFLYEASELLHGRWDDAFGSGRLSIWRQVLALVPERLLLGGGPDTLALRGTIAFQRYDPALGAVLYGTVDAAHNEYLHILVNQGLPALALYLGALATAAAGWVRRAQDSPAAAALGTGVLGYCVQAFFGISSPLSAPYLWLALALLVRTADPPHTAR